MRKGHENVGFNLGRSLMVGLLLSGLEFLLGVRFSDRDGSLYLIVMPLVLTILRFRYLSRNLK